MKRNSGFTLLELMIVVVVMAILAALAINSYSEQVRKSKRAEAVKSILQFQMSMEKYRAGCPTYADQASCRDRTVPADGDAVDTEDVPYPSIPDVAQNNYTYAVSGQSTTGYTITATKKASFADTKCGNFTMTVANSVSTKDVSVTGNKDYCWRN